VILKAQRTFNQTVGALFWFVMLVGCASPPEPAVLPEANIQINTKIPVTITATDIHPTSTNTVLPTFTKTHSPTESPTESPTSTSTETPTFTPEPALLTLQQETVCMTGASFGHSVNHYVSTGSEYPILGQLIDRSWWLVGINDGEDCWVYGEYSLVRGTIDDLPIMTPPPIPSKTPTPQPATPGIYYILISTDIGGPFGCGDSLIQYYPGVWVKGSKGDDIKGALNALFSNHNQYTNGLYNPIYQSELKAKSVDVTENDVFVYLAGKLVRPKDSCESRRMHDQIWYTVRQFSSTRAIIYLHNALLGDLLVVSKK
jgi:hypothetical protein